MCGYLFSYSRAHHDFDPEKEKRCLEILQSRGPNFHKSIHSEKFIAIQTRLSIVDQNFQEAGPFFCPQNRFMLLYNGEIYNYSSLRRDLITKGHQFKTKTDTEVLLHTLLEYKESALEKLDGVFSFVFFDTLKNEILFARDTIGVKPLYYYHHKDTLLVSTDLRALHIYSPESFSVNDQAQSSYFLYRYSKDQRTVDARFSRAISSHYYQLHHNFQLKIKSYLYKTKDKKTISECLTSSIKKRLQSEHPVASLLSSGIDSNAITSIGAQEISQCYTVDLQDWHREADQSKKYANEYGLPHKIVPLPKDSYMYLDKILWHLEEPLGDSIIIPTNELFREISEKYRIVLSGEGADEIFAGYAHIKTILKYHSLLSLPGKHLFSPLISLIPSQVLEAIVPYPSKMGGTALKKKLKKLSSLNTIGDLYLSMGQLFEGDEDYLSPFLKRNMSEYVSHQRELHSSLTIDSLLKKDLSTWCQNYTLPRLDKLSMAYGVEARVPFLDLQLVSLSLQHHPKENIKGNLTKNILRKAISTQLNFPIDLLKKKKIPFHFNASLFYGNKYLNYCKEVLLDPSTSKSDLFNQNQLEKYLNSTKFSNELVEDKKLSSMLIYTLWLKNQKTMLL